MNADFEQIIEQFHTIGYQTVCIRLPENQAGTQNLQGLSDTVSWIFRQPTGEVNIHGEEIWEILGCVQKAYE